MHFDVENPLSPLNDHFILSKGHAAPLLYAAWHERGVLTEEELLTLRSFNSVLEGHPTPRFPYIPTATGSLGIGLSIGAGIALNGQHEGYASYTYVLMGDSEVSEGSVWEAAQIASFYKLDHLIGIIDINRLGQSTQTMEGYNLEDYRAKCEAFGWHALTVDGHDVMKLVEVFHQAKAMRGKPTMILAKTVKGYGIGSIEGKENYHGKAFSKEELPGVLHELHDRFINVADMHLPEPRYISLPLPEPQPIEPFQLPPAPYNLDERVPTRKAYGQALAACGEYTRRIIALDAEVKNSTYAEIFEKKFPERFVQCFIAEQTMIGMAVGLATQGKMPFASTFGAFITRAHDQIRMAAIGRTCMCVVGSHAGVSIGQDGPSQMALEDIALMRSIPDSIILYPCDAVSTYKLVALMAQHSKGICYLRTTRGATPVIYKADKEFKIGGCSILEQSARDSVCVIAAGITVFEALKAYEQLAKKNIFITVIDCYSIKPLDLEIIQAAVLAAGNRVITVEDHYPQGGLGEAICSALCNQEIKLIRLAVYKLPRSGKPEELMRYEEIDAQAIIQAVERLQLV
jgi:transketolase